jgi:membrane protein DedA with SNARE-associated domain
MFDQFTHLVADASGWAYAVIFVFALVDAVIPLVPSETAVITAGVVAVEGSLNLWVVIAAAAAGAFSGDNIAYGLGSRFGARIKDRFFRGEKSRQRLDWAERQLKRRGGELIAVARFIPGGRTAVTLTAGTLDFAWRRFAMYDAIAAVIWALYASLLGYFGGQAFENAPWKGLVLAFVVAFGVTGLTELTRWYLRRRKSRRGERVEE